jgi:hypothetical protein
METTSTVTLTFEIFGSQQYGSEMVLFDESTYLWGYSCTIKAHHKQLTLEKC